MTSINMTKVTVSKWPELVMPEREIQATLAYLAYRTGKPVRVCYEGGEMAYSSTTIVVCVLPENREEANEKRIVNEDGKLLAVVNHNCVMIAFDLLDRDDQTARDGLAKVALEACDLLDFKVGELVKDRQRSLADKMQACLLSAISDQLSEKKYELSSLDVEAEAAYRKILESERRRPTLDHEIKVLNRLSASKSSSLARRQAEALMRLHEEGTYEDFTISPSGAFYANTGEIVIDYDGYTFPLGRYRIEIDPRGVLFIKNLDEHPNAEFPHPHVSNDYKPCLGNMTSALPKLIGRMQFAEALQIIHTFLSSYNPTSPYEKIGSFDPTGSYIDDDNPCEHCSNCCDIYCIMECGCNQGFYGCTDCIDYRTDFCFGECRYNHDYEMVNPCDDCSRPDAECYLDCQWNQEWELHNPCDDCEKPNCEGCDYLARKEALNYEKQ